MESGQRQNLCLSATAHPVAPWGYLRRPLSEAQRFLPRTALRLAERIRRVVGLPRPRLQDKPKCGGDGANFRRRPLFPAYGHPSDSRCTTGETNITAKRSANHNSEILSYEWLRKSRHVSTNIPMSAQLGAFPAEQKVLRSPKSLNLVE
jgi:hypothetical protein